jgi:ankyrin repeat protein
MGNCGSSKKPLEIFNNIFLRAEKIIQHNDLFSFELLTHTEEFRENFKAIDKAYFEQDSLKLNLLSLAAYSGSGDCFKQIHSELKSSFDTTNDLLTSQGTSLLEVICTRGNIDILDYFLPHFKSNPRRTVTSELAESLEFEEQEKNEKLKTKQILTPIMKACEMGNINIIAHVFKHFKDKKPVPYELDINYQDDRTGENCALIACRSGNYAMIRFLHQNCHCNFRITNKLGENALQVLAAANNKSEMKEFHECLVFLVNHVGVDVIYNYEETLLLIQSERSIMFLEKKLSDKGIVIEKEEIEAKNRIMKVQHVKSMIEEKLDCIVGKNFNFCTMYAECMDDDDDQISVISDHPANGKPFESFLSDVNPNT